jgi:hypothetical protein
MDKIECYLCTEEIVDLRGVLLEDPLICLCGDCYDKIKFSLNENINKIFEVV